MGSNSSSSSSIAGGIAVAQHDILLIIATGLFILFATALAGPPKIPITPVILSA